MGSAGRRGLYLATMFTKTSMPPDGFESAIPLSERPQTYPPLSGITVGVIKRNEDEKDGHAARVGGLGNLYTISA